MTYIILLLWLLPTAILVGDSLARYYRLPASARSVAFDPESVGMIMAALFVSIIPVYNWKLAYSQVISKL